MSYGYTLGLCYTINRTKFEDNYDIKREGSYHSVFEESQQNSNQIKY